MTFAKGKQERHYLTIQMRFYREAERSGLMTLQELNEFFWAWLDECYHKQKHSVIGMTPLARWQQEEEIIERISPETIHEGLQLQSRRKIGSKTGIIKLNGKMYQAGSSLAGQCVQVRWPFDDDSYINIFRNGKYVERAARFVPGADIDYSKRPNRQAKKEIPRVLDCSKQFKAALLAKFRFEKKAEETSRYGVLTEKEFVYVFEECMERTLHDSELQLMPEAYKRLFPMDAEFIEKALSQAKSRKGKQMHIRFYVKYMEEYKSKMR